MDDKLLVTTGELARMLGCSKRHIANLVRGGAMPKPVRLGRAIRWRRDDIERWIVDDCEVAANG